MKWNVFESLFCRIVTKMFLWETSGRFKFHRLQSHNKFFFQAETSDIYGIQKGFMSALKQNLLDLQLKDESPRQQCHDGVTRQAHLKGMKWKTTMFLFYLFLYIIIHKGFPSL